MSGTCVVSPSHVGLIVTGLESLDPSVLSKADVSAALISLATVRAWVDTVAVRLARRVHDLAATEPSIVADAVIAAASRSSRRDAGQLSRRAKTLTAVPALEQALADGAVSVGHVDGMTRALAKLDEARRGLLASDGQRLTEIAARSTPEQFERKLKIEVLRLDAGSGEDRLARQQRATRLRSWTDPETGMVIIHCEYDPDTGLTILSRIDALTNTMFHDATPDSCPDGDGKHDHLRALALAKLINNRTPTTATPTSTSSTSSSSTTHATHPADHIDTADDRECGDRECGDRECGNRDDGECEDPGAEEPTATNPDVGAGADVDIALLDNRCEMIIVIDLETITNGLHNRSIIDNGHNIDLPIETYRRMACYANIIPVVLDSNGVTVDLGRSVRLATKQQRRALLAMYDTCAIPGCTVTSRHCQPHHIHWWINFGPTDLDNLIPICSKHHHNVHEGGWQLHLARNRTLTITYPNGTTQTTGPPRTQRPAA